jgi:hypothetical protein
MWIMMIAKQRCVVWFVIGFQIVHYSHYSKMFQIEQYKHSWKVLVWKVFFKASNQLVFTSLERYVNLRFFCTLYVDWLIQSCKWCQIGFTLTRLIVMFSHIIFMLNFLYCNRRKKIPSCIWKFQYQHNRYCKVKFVQVDKHAERLKWKSQSENVFLS